MSLHEAAEKALEALEITTAFVDGCPIDWGRGYVSEADEAINALRAALAEAEEPVAWRVRVAWTNGRLSPWRVYQQSAKPSVNHPECCDFEPLFTHPPRREPLTDEAIRELWSWASTHEAEKTATTQQHAFARAIEKFHGIGGDE